MAEQFVDQLILVLDLLQDLFLFYLMLAWTLGLEASVYGLCLVEELSESLGKTGDAVKRFGDLVNYSNTELSFVFGEVLFGPV